MGKRFAIVIGVAAAAVMALGAQTATSGEPVDTVPPDIWLWGEIPERCCLVNKTQKLSKAVEVNVGCGDEACTVSARGQLYWYFKHGEGKAAARLRTHELPGVRHDRLKPAGAENVGPGETTQLKLRLKQKTRKRARRALRHGKTLVAEVIVGAKDAAGNRAWYAQAAIRLIKHGKEARHG